MRPTIIFLNFLIVFFFGVFFAYTFFAKDHLKSLARDYAISRTVSYADPLVKSAEEKFQNPAIQTLTPGKQKKLIQSEFESYRKDPANYLLKLAEKSSSSPSNSKLLGKFVPFKEKILTHFDKKLKSLLTDLRIFAGSNIIAGSIALLFALRSPPRVRALLPWLSFLMFLAVCFASYIYIDGFNFFAILDGSHMGWTYPCILVYFIARLFWELLWSAHDLVDKIDETN